MDKVKRVYSYKTTDGKTFSGKNAAEKAKEHQKRVNFIDAIGEIMPEMEEIFKLEDGHTSDGGDTDESELVDVMNDELLYQCDDFDELIRRFVDVYLEVPGIAKCFQLIEHRFKDSK